MEKTQNYIENPLGTKPIKKLLISFAWPAITANIINAMYSVIDQIFIGQGVGYLGNAATNVAFPLTTICLAIRCWYCSFFIIYYRYYYYNFSTYFLKATYVRIWIY